MPHSKHTTAICYITHLNILLLLLCVANIATVNFKLHNTCCLFQKCVIDCLTMASQKFHEWIFDITARYWNKFLYKIQWQLSYVKFKVPTLVSKSNFQWWSCHLGAGRSLALVVILVALSQPTTRTGAGHAAVTSPSRWKKYSSVQNNSNIAHIYSAITHDQDPHQHWATVKTWNHLYIYHTCKKDKTIFKPQQEVTALFHFSTIFFWLH